ncbi:MAG: CDP-alcohol phosphatidyltransferase family protein, partial [Ktedonobacterales bacterium]|nr:CDP-alcohol phosphatidyltransferase family protein [Ktedonobacterales bacterium]
LLAARPAPQPAALAALVIGGASDIADGALARRTGRQTRLGAYLDAVADYESWAALALTLGARRLLPRWLVALLLARFSAPFAFALATYFGWVRRVPLGSTSVGKAAGVAQAVAFTAALAPARLLSPRARTTRQLLYGVTAVLLLAAPLIQLRRILAPPPRAP